MNRLDRVHEQIDLKKSENLDEFIALASQPSIAASNEGIEECCSLVCDLLRSIKMKPMVFRKEGRSPIIYGELKCQKEGAKTILFYGHYDVQPAEPLEDWISPPFEPAIRDGKLFARGAGDNKGQFLAHILAIRAYQETGTEIPVNVKFLLEGEEETGSEHIKEFVEPHKEMLKADLCYTSDGGMHVTGRPNIFFGVRGLAELEVTLNTCKQDNHSGNKGNLIPSAAWEMVKLLNSLIDVNGNCTVEGFYDGVVEPTAYELSEIEKLHYDPEETARVFGVKNITLNKREFYTNLMFKPTFNINGLSSGYTGPGSKTIIPGTATVRLDMRLVGNQDPERVAELVAEHIRRVCPEATVSVAEGIWPSATDSSLPICKAVTNAVGRVYKCEPYVMPRIGATLPEYLFTKIVGIPALTMPYANADENNHAPNENMSVECFYKGIHCTAEVLSAVGGMI